MDADAYHCGHERVVLFCVDHHTVQTIIIEYPVVDPFSCSALVIDFFIGIRAARDIRVQTDIPFRPGFYDPAIFRRCAAVFTFRTVVFAKRAPPHEIAAGFVIAVGDHAEFFLAEGCPIPVDRYRIRDRLRPPAFIVEVNERPDPAVFQEPVGWVVVHGGVEAYVHGKECRHMFFQLMESNKEADGIMAFGTGEAQKERDIRFQSGVVTRELEEGVAEVMLFQVAVPSPGSIGVREMAHVVRGAFPVVPAWAGMGMDGSAIAGNGEKVIWDYAAFDGREDGGMVKKELEPPLKVERDVFAVHQPCGNGFCDLWPGLLCFLFFAFRLLRLPAVP